jgi:sulfatase-like protein
MSGAEVAAGERRPARETRRREGVRRALWDYAHLAVLSTFALAQPLFDLLGQNPEFFAARGAPALDILSFSLLVVVAPPALLLAVELLGGLVHARLRQALHLTFIAVLVALVAVQALKKAIDAADLPLIVLAAVAGILAATAYARSEPVRSFMSVLSPAPIVFLALFLFVSPVSKLAFPSEASAKSVGGVARAPIVMVLLDELPTESLMTDRRRVDPVRYPAFAELAKDATWFRNAYAVYDSTERAQPAIMDGNYPEKDKLPTSADHPNSIFSLFAKTHRMNVSEEATSVCSRDLCKDERLDEPYRDRMRSLGKDLGLVWLHVVSPPDIESELPSVSENWGNFGGEAPAGGGAAAPGDQPNTRANLNRNRNKRFQAWIARVQPSHRPGLNFKHSLLPHVPWQYLPSGKQYRRTARDPIPGLSSYAYDDQGQLDSLYQRHLLQLGFTDRELGALLRKLKRTGLYDEALVVVAADHGVAFDRGERDRRTVTRKNLAEIVPIPLFVKAPGQEEGGVDEAYVETVDILPTIFDVLDVDPRVRMDGKSAFSPEVQRRRGVRVLERGTFEEIRVSSKEYERRKRAVLEKKLRLFGVGSDGPERLFRIGPNPELLGRAVGSLTVSEGAGADFVAPGEYRNVDLRSPTVPTHVTGFLHGTPPGRDLAIAVNGTIRAVSRSFRLVNRDGVLFAAMVPESSFRQGANRVEVFEVTDAGGLRRLGRV